MKATKRIVIVGATSAIAEHCARLWADEGKAEFILIGRWEERLQRVASDLGVRYPHSELTCLTVADFSDPLAIKACMDGVYAQGPIDLALIAHGSLPSQTDCQRDLGLCRETLIVNGVSPSLWAEAVAGVMTQQNHGTLVLIGSVAGDRGRRSNYVYGASKGLVTRYAQGLQHRFAGSPVKVILVKPGPTDTPMTADFKAKGMKLASVEDVAKSIVSGVAAGKTVIYAPGKWGLIMMVIRHLPNIIFNRMNI